MPASILIQRPAGDAQQLILLFHGVGADAQDMAPVGEHIAQAFPGAFVVSVDAALPSDMGSGRQWFSVLGVTPATRPARVAAAMPAFLAAVQHWQAQSGVGAAGTVLVGFSQGAIMALEATQLAAAPAQRIVALAGRLAQPARVAPTGIAVHFIHGQQDPVIPAVESEAAAAQLQALGAHVTRDLLPGLAHGIDGRALALALARIAGREPATR